MKASIVDLRYHMNDVLKALDRNEEVEVLYHNKKIGTIYPFSDKKTTQVKVQDHPFYGMTKKTKLSVDKEMDKLRGGRYNDL